jgi:hypothetical protein
VRFFSKEIRHDHGVLSLIFTERGSEDFDMEDDINDWEFSLEALKWWEKKIKELQDVTDS